MHFSMLLPGHQLGKNVRYVAGALFGNKFMLACSAWGSVGQAPRTVSYSAFLHQHVGTRLERRSEVARWTWRCSSLSAFTRRWLENKT